MKVFIRTVTHYFVGELVEDSEAPRFGPGFLYLRHCSWVADTGRFHAALASGTLPEVEPYPAEDVVSVNLGAIVDIAPWNHKLPTKVK